MIAALTPRQREVMDLVIEGYSNKDIQWKLGLSKRTVEHHCEQAYRRLGTSGQGTLVSRRQGAIRYAALLSAAEEPRPEPRRRKAVQAESLGLELV